MSTQYPHCTNRSAFTLLEVLVAGGILVVALASIAAILPAAASRLGDANAIDRANALDAIALSEIQTRGLASRLLFANTSAAGVVIGESVPSAVLTTVTNSGYAGVQLTTSLTVTGGTLFNSGVALLTRSNTAVLNMRADVSRGYFLEDDIVYMPSTATALPAHVFSGVTGSSGFRQFQQGVSWGAILTPEPWGTASSSMSAVRASVAVFRKPTTAVGITLTRQGPGIFCTGTTAVPGVVQRTRLRPCSFVLALPPTTTSGAGNGPQWLGIRTSWMTTGTSFWLNGGTVVSSTGSLDALTSGSSQAFVVFDRDPPAAMLTTSGSLLTVLTFENLLLTDQKILPVR